MGSARQFKGPSEEAGTFLAVFWDAGPLGSCLGVRGFLNDADVIPISSALQVQWLGDWLSS